VNDVARLWLDTNVTRSSKRIAQLRSLARRKGVRLIIHPQVYLERRRQMRAKTGPLFDPVAFDDFLKLEGIEVPEFVLDQATAATWADTLHERYPKDEAWELAKKRTLGGELRAGFSTLPGDMPMTTDWLIALVVEHDPSSWVITNENRGEEWRCLREAQPCRALRWDEAITWLNSLPDAPEPEEDAAEP
jgi:hypothetical protein